MGRMVSLRCSCEENYAAHGSRKTIVQIGLGGRFEIAGLRPGVEVRALRWIDLDTRGSVSGPPPPLPPLRGTTLTVLVLTVSLGLSL